MHTKTINIAFMSFYSTVVPGIKKEINRQFRFYELLIFKLKQLPIFRLKLSANIISPFYILTRDMPV